MCSPIASIGIGVHPTFRRLHALATLVAAASVAACGGNDSGVDASRADRSISSADSVASATTGDITSPTTPTDAGSPADTEPPTAPGASGPGSISADDLEGIFLSEDPDLLEATNVLVSDVEPSTFINETLTFTGSPTPIVIAGAPITNWSYTLLEPVFGGEAVSGAAGITVRYRMTVELTTNAVNLAEIDEKAEALRDDLRAVVEDAYPGEEVRDTLSETPLGNDVHGLAIGPQDTPTTHVEVSMQYIVAPRLVTDQLLGIRITRRQNEVTLAELPARSVFVDEVFQEQIDLVDAAPSSDERSATFHAVSFNVPSSGLPTVNRFVEYDYPVATDDFDAVVDDVGALVEPSGYEPRAQTGDTRRFADPASSIEASFSIDRNGDASALVGIQGDIVATP